MQGKPTAGPWALNPIRAQVDAFVGGKALPICQLLWPTKERSEAETWANGEVIAALPDTLARLAAYEAALRELDAAICELRSEIHPGNLAAISEIARGKLDLALARARKALEEK